MCNFRSKGSVDSSLLLRPVLPLVAVRNCSGGEGKEKSDCPFL